METLYIKIDMPKSNPEADAIRNEGLLFQFIAEAIAVDGDAVQEIDENNYLSIINEIKDKYSDWPGQ